MMAISALVNSAVGKPVAAAARLARRALERINPMAEGKAAAAPRKSKGWRRHMRKAKARERGAKG
jgi:hypothetical protein